MELLIAMKPIRSGNELLKTGEKFIIQDSRLLIKKGYARRLTEDETQTILSEYVKYAEDLFSETPEKKTISVNREHRAFYQGRLI
jgi:hypothetical protein